MVGINREPVKDRVFSPEMGLMNLGWGRNARDEGNRAHADAVAAMADSLRAVPGTVLGLAGVAHHRIHRVGAAEKPIRSDNPSGELPADQYMVGPVSENGRTVELSVYPPNGVVYEALVGELCAASVQVENVD